MPDFTLYLDEDVNPMLAEILIQRGFAVKTTKTCSMLGKSDEEQLQFTSQNGYVFLTHNIADFCQLAKTYVEQEKKHSGILLAPQWKLPLLLQATLRFLQETQKDLTNQLVGLHRNLQTP